MSPQYERLRDAVTMYAGDGVISDDDVIRMATEQAQAASTFVPEVCVCAAIKMPDGYIVRGHRHDDCLICAGCMERYARDKGALHAALQGFMTTRDRFVDRPEGAALQRAVGIVSVDTGRFTDFLFSEDLY